MINVVREEKGKAAVSVNGGAMGRFVYSSPALANQEAKKLQERHYPNNSTLRLL